MNDFKNKRIKEQRKLMTWLMIVAAGLLLVLSFLSNDEDLKLVLLIISAALLAGVITARFFKGSFGYKPTLEEMEEMQFGKKSKISIKE